LCSESQKWDAAARAGVERFLEIARAQGCELRPAVLPDHTRGIACISSAWIAWRDLFAATREPDLDSLLKGKR
jgi:hypothetical protein